jgi:hypothetical protein
MRRLYILKIGKAKQVFPEVARIARADSLLETKFGKRHIVTEPRLN